VQFLRSEEKNPFTGKDLLTSLSVTYTGARSRTGYCVCITEDDSEPNKQELSQKIIGMLIRFRDLVRILHFVHLKAR
jgi:hypothetical protein